MTSCSLRGGRGRRPVKSLGIVACAALGAALAFAQGTSPTPTTPKKETPVKPADAKTEGKKDVAVIKTNKGTIVFEFLPDVAPKMVANFKDLAKSGFYNGTTFHRVINGFMIQGGGFTKDLQQKPVQPPIKNESTNGLKNANYTVAMARTNVPDSASAQFFINVKDNDFLDRAKARDKVGYAVFGKVIEGMDVVEKIRRVETADRGGHENVPVNDVVIKSVRRVEKK